MAPALLMAVIGMLGLFQNFVYIPLPFTITSTVVNSIITVTGIASLTFISYRSMAYEQIVQKADPTQK